MSEKLKDNPLVALTLWFRDGAALRQVFDSPVSQMKTMTTLGRMVAEMGGELNIEFEGTLHARLESDKVEYRGVNITGETEEEKQVLLNIWNQHGRPVALDRQGGSVTITIAPVAEDEKESTAITRRRQ